jgi:hypothetical protein
MFIHYRYSDEGNEETQVVVDHQHRSEPSCSVMELFIVQHAKCMPMYVFVCVSMCRT